MRQDYSPKLPGFGNLRNEGMKKQAAMNYHDLSDGGGRDAVALLGLLELLDGDGGAPAARSLGMRWLEAREEDEAVGSLPKLSHQIVLLQPRGAVRPAGAAVPHRRCRPSTKALSFCSRGSSSETRQGLRRTNGSTGQFRHLSRRPRVWAAPKSGREKLGNRIGREDWGRGCFCKICSVACILTFGYGSVGRDGFA